MTVLIEECVLLLLLLCPGCSTDVYYVRSISKAMCELCHCSEIGVQALKGQQERGTLHPPPQLGLS